MESKILPREIGSGSLPNDDHQPVKIIQLSEETLRIIISEAVGESLTRLGVSWDNPLEMQRDFTHLREWREVSETIRRGAWNTIIASFVAGALGAIWLGLKSILTKGG